MRSVNSALPLLSPLLLLLLSLLRLSLLRLSPRLSPPLSLSL
jgi:hypothetical protein